MIGLSYGTVGSNRLEAAKAFYDALLGPHDKHSCSGRGNWDS